jgi:hypothetical protein
MSEMASTQHTGSSAMNWRWFYRISARRPIWRSWLIH